jgi:hypothetical protein
MFVIAGGFRRNHEGDGFRGLFDDHGSLETVQRGGDFCSGFRVADFVEQLAPGR